jgi:hypothetical protein
MLLTQEKITGSPIIFSQALSDLVDTTANLKFTKQGVRICKIPKVYQKRAKSNEVSFRIRNNRGNLTA